MGPPWHRGVRTELSKYGTIRDILNMRNNSSNVLIVIGFVEINFYNMI